MPGRISHETVELVHSTADIVALVGEYTRLERRGGNDWWGCCPFHGEKTASFHVDGEKKFYYCFGCHASGDVIKFLMEMEKVSYGDAVSALARKNGIPVKYQEGQAPARTEDSEKISLNIELYERTASMFHYMLMETEQGKPALDYIRARGLTDDTIKKFKLGYAPSDRHWLKNFLRKKNFSDEFLRQTGLFSRNYPDVSLFSDRLMFPIFNRDGKAVAFGGRILNSHDENAPKYLNSPELAHYKKRETLYAFNFARRAIKDSKKAILCEGYMDCIAYHQCGIDYAVAPLGTAFTEDQVRMLRGFADTVLLSFDSDAAGQNATLKAIYMCRRQNLTVKVIRLKGGKDPAEIMINFGKKNLTAQVNSAILDSDFLLNRLGGLYPVDTPEGKTKAALEFFTYVDALQSDIQKSSSLELLCQTFNLKPEAVNRDYLNRRQAQERTTTRSKNNQSQEDSHIRVDAELRGLLAVVSDLAQFKKIRSSLTARDFKNPVAGRLFCLLEECLARDELSLPEILGRVDDDGLSQLIAGSVSDGMYQENAAAVVDDTIRYVRRRNLDERRGALTKRIGEFSVVTAEDEAQLRQLLAEKMELDRQAQALSK